GPPSTLQQTSTLSRPSTLIGLSAGARSCRGRAVETCRCSGNAVRRALLKDSLPHNGFGRKMDLYTFLLFLGAAGLATMALQGIGGGHGGRGHSHGHAHG